MSLFGNSYEDAVYRKNYAKPREKEWYEIPYQCNYIVYCGELSRAEVETLFTKLVNGIGAVDDDDIIVDEDEDIITYFEIVGNYSFTQTKQIEDKLDKFKVDYSVK